MPGSEPQSVPEILRDLREMLTAYAKQETLDPLKALTGRFKFGIAGGMLVGLGGFFLALGALRGFQRLPIFSYNLSFLPYFFVIVFLVVWSILLVRLIQKGSEPTSTIELGRKDAAR